MKLYISGILGNMEANEPLGPPELGKDTQAPAKAEPKNPVPQLVKSKPTIVPKKPEDETPDEPFIAAYRRLGEAPFKEALYGNS